MFQRLLRGGRETHPRGAGERCGYDAPGSFAAWLSDQTTMHACQMPGKRYDVGDLESYEQVKKLAAEGTI